MTEVEKTVVTQKKRGRPPTYRTAEEKSQSTRENSRRYANSEKGKIANQRYIDKINNRKKAEKEILETIASLELAQLEARAGQLSREELIGVLRKITQKFEFFVLFEFKYSLSRLREK